MIDPILLAVTRISTIAQDQVLTNATGFFFTRDERLFLATSRHVMIDNDSNHLPDRLDIELHIDPENMAISTFYSIPLYGKNGDRLWRQGVDNAGEVDMAVIEIDRTAFPATTVYHEFTPIHLEWPSEHVEVGTDLLIVGFPLGFKDTLHHMPVVRRGIVSSSFGLRFQGEGYFLTDARTHRGSSGAPVVIRARDGRSNGPLPWVLLGVHSSRLDVGNRDQELDEALGLNCAWYADILMTLTEG